MALIRILVKDDLTGMFYVKEGTDSQKCSLTGHTQDKTQNGHFWPHVIKCGLN